MGVKTYYDRSEEKLTLRPSVKMFRQAETTTSRMGGIETFQAVLSPSSEALSADSSMPFFANRQLGWVKMGTSNLVDLV